MRAVFADHQLIENIDIFNKYKVRSSIFALDSNIFWFFFTDTYKFITGKLQKKLNKIFAIGLGGTMCLIVLCLLNL